MSYRLLIPFLLLFLPLPSSAQVDTSAMLQQLLEMPADSNKVLFLLEVGDLWEYSDPDKAIQYYREAEELASTIDYGFGKARAIQYQGVTYNNNGRYAEGIETNQKAYEAFRTIQDSTYMAMSLVNVGNGYLYQGVYEVALPYYLDAAQLFERKGQIPYYHFTLGNIHSIYTYLNDAQRQLEYGEKMMALASDSDSLMLGDSHQKYALGLMYTGQFQQARRHLDTALVIAEAIGDPVSKIICNSNIGDLYYFQEDYETAQLYFTQTVALAREHGDPYYLGQSLDDLGKVKIKLGQLTEARSHLQEAMIIAEENGHQESVLSVYGHLALLEEQTGNSKAAFDYWHTHNELRDSIFNQTSRNQIAALDIRHQTAQRQNRIAALEAENEIQGLRLRQRNIILWSLLGGLLVLLALLYVLRRNAAQRQHLAALNARIEGEQRERLRIAEDLHDDFGSGLSKISLLSEVARQEVKQEVPAIDKIVHSSRQLQRKMGEIVWALNIGNDSLASLVAYLRRYLAEFFEDTAIQYRFEAPDELPDHGLSGEERRNLFLTIKEALHNVLKHSEADEVLIRIALQKGTLQLQVTDNGKGLPAEQLAYGSGLRNMKKRMEAIGGQFEINGAVGTTVSLHYPLS